MTSLHCTHAFLYKIVYHLRVIVIAIAIVIAIVVVVAVVVVVGGVGAA